MLAIIHCMLLYESHSTHFSTSADTINTHLVSDEKFSRWWECARRSFDATTRTHSLFPSTFLDCSTVCNKCTWSFRGPHKKVSPSRTPRAFLTVDRLSPLGGAEKQIRGAKLCQNFQPTAPYRTPKDNPIERYDNDRY